MARPPQAYTGHPPPAKPGRDKSSVSADRAAVLNAAQGECTNLMEWLVVDMSEVAKIVLPQVLGRRQAARAVAKLRSIHELGVLARMQAVARSFAEEVGREGAPELDALAKHPSSDVPRQWAAYAAQLLALDAKSKLKWAKRSAADGNMTVRECAWMAYRPEVAKNPRRAIRILSSLTTYGDANVRRFAIEVTRPRSVWGAHIGELKTAPEVAESMLAGVAADESRYVRLAVGNWINDAAKSQPAWATELFQRWDAQRREIAPDVRRRALRSLVTQ